jgi:uncharacterized membrane protein HdeD (DUF308 family)
VGVVNRTRSTRRIPALCAGALGAALSVAGTVVSTAPTETTSDLGGALGMSLVLSGACLLVAVSRDRAATAPA